MFAATLLLAGGAPAAADVAPAAGGTGFLAAAEGAPDVLVGRVQGTSQLDLHGWRATLVVERALRGRHAAGDTLAIAWEELSTKRPARFADGASVALALEPLPPGSLWTARFPTREALAIAARGEGFLREPDAATLEPLAAWLALPPDAREADAGVAALAALAARGAPPVAASALARLDRVPGLGKHVVGPGLESLAGLLRDAERPLELRRSALDLVARREVRALEATVEALAAAPSPVQGPALDALARLRGEFGPERTAELLRDPDPAVRAAAARRGGADGETLRSLMAHDPAPEVRAAAAEALAARADASVADDLVAALRDPAGPVRAAALRGLEHLGPEALPALRREIWETEPLAATGGPGSAVLALALVGPEGAGELQRIAHEHPSERVRRLAELALGRLPSDE